jgi:hypothetical protein
VVALFLSKSLLQGRSRANDAVHEYSVVTDGQLGCTCGFWISDSWPGEGKRDGLEDHCGAAGYKYAYHLIQYVRSDASVPARKSVEVDVSIQKIELVCRTTGSLCLLGQHTTPLGARDDRLGLPLVSKRVAHGLPSLSLVLSLLRTGAFLCPFPPAKVACFPGVYKRPTIRYRR